MVNTGAIAKHTKLVVQKDAALVKLEIKQQVQKKNTGTSAGSAGDANPKTTKRAKS